MLLTLCYLSSEWQSLKWTVTIMGTEEPKDPLKGVDWNAVGKKPKKIRQIPECYFLPRRSLLYNISFSVACIAGGIGAGMLAEMWMNKKVKEDGGIILWEFDM